MILVLLLRVIRYTVIRCTIFSKSGYTIVVLGVIVYAEGSSSKKSAIELLVTCK